MRSTEERIAAVGRRTSALRQREKIRRNRLVGLSAVAAALALVVGLGLAMPGMMGRMEAAEHVTVGGMASIFSQGSGMGYVLIALLAFALGVCVTVLCSHLRGTTKKPGLPEEKEEERGG